MLWQDGHSGMTDRTDIDLVGSNQQVPCLPGEVSRVARSQTENGDRHSAIVSPLAKLIWRTRWRGDPAPTPILPRNRQPVILNEVKPCTLTKNPALHSGAGSFSVRFSGTMAPRTCYPHAKGLWVPPAG